MFQNKPSYEKLKEYRSQKEYLKINLEREPIEGEIENENELKNFTIEKEDEDDFELIFRLGVSNNNLTKTRKELGLLQRDVAKMINVGTQVYGHIETCLVYPSEEIQKKISKVLKKRKEYLFPEWLKMFTNSWKRAEKQKLVKMNTLNLNSPEVKLLEDEKDLNHLASLAILKDRISGCLEHLNTREKKIIEMRFGFNGEVPHDLESIGKEFDVNRERIRQIEAKALERIKGYIGKEKLVID